MPIVVRVVTAQEYTAWVGAEKKKSLAKADDPTKVYAKEELIARGEKLYAANCQVCHQATGKGAGAIKAVDGAAVVLGEKAGQINVLLNGQNNQAMPAWKQLNDVEIASVITYTRNSWGNAGQGKDPVLQPSDITVARAGK